MTPDRWRRIEALYHAALAEPLDARARYLTDACAGDAALRHEVESLLAHGETPSADFLEPPAGAVADRKSVV